ncbi:MAG: precorrin-6A/cobalt-precorrin-6A reductase [Lachnospiraceae bacterium]|nr:precorrin-6A/cobalt-precorrin-6A reductase [Lachnospiraceae bacterium]
MNPCKVIIFGGTTEGRELARTLTDRGALVTVSVATELGEEMLRDISAEEEPGHFRTLVGRMNVGDMLRTLKGYDICYDATHPYAVEVTANLREACGKTGTEYIRVIRKEEECSELNQGPGGVLQSETAQSSETVPDSESDRKSKAVQKSEDVQRSDSIIIVRSAADAAAYLLETEGNILFTTGSKELRACAEIPRERMYVRVLPTRDSIAACEEADIPHRNIIAMFGPFTQRMNEAMLEQYHISYLVTKEAGRNGGFEEKMQAAKACGVKAIVIRRPEDSGVTVEEAAAMFKYQQSGKIL